MEREALQRWLEEGLSLEQIGARVGRHPSTVGYWVAKHGLAACGRDRHSARGAIEREVLEELVARGLTVRRIAAEVGRSTATVRHWLNRYGLRTARAARAHNGHGAAPGERFSAVCAKHGPTEFVVRGDGGTRCVRCRAEGVIERRRRVKAMLVAEAGGACSICGYDRCAWALQFHHVDATQKAFCIGRGALTLSLERMRAEAEKCVLLCANCHAEVEGGFTSLPG